VKKLIIFDMDGTLVDSSQTIANAINHVRNHIGLPPMESQKIIEKINDHHLNPAQYFYETDQFKGEHETWFSEYYTQHHQRELILYSDIKEMLEELKSSDFKLAIATNAYRGSTIESLTHLDIYHLFDTIACYDDVSRGKPHPDMLLKILQDLDIPSNHAIFVGDGERDEIASMRAGIEYIMVDWGFDRYKDAVANVDSLLREIRGISS
jgi:phosphoglycolate phosphatase